LGTSFCTAYLEVVLIFATLASFCENRDTPPIRLRIYVVNLAEAVQFGKTAIGWQYYLNNR